MIHGGTELLLYFLCASPFTIRMMSKIMNFMIASFLPFLLPLQARSESARSTAALFIDTPRGIYVARVRNIFHPWCIEDI